MNKSPHLFSFALAAIAAVLAVSLGAQQMQPTATRRARVDRERPYDRLVIRAATIIDGTGAPPRGPVDLVVTHECIS